MNYDFLITPKDFMEYVLSVKEKSPDSSYLEIIAEKCEELDIDIEKILTVIPQSLILLIEKECENLNLISKTNRLGVL